MVKTIWDIFHYLVATISGLPHHSGGGKADAPSVSLALGEARMETDKEVTLYSITDQPESPTLRLNDNNGVDMTIVFKRRLTNEAMMTFFPFLILITISYATSFFKQPNFFNTAITVVKKLAQTSYIKWIEWWLIFAMLIPFSQAILITCIEWSKEREMVRSEEQAGLGVNIKLVQVQ